MVYAIKSSQKIYGITLNPWTSKYNLSKKLSIYGGHIQFCPLAPFVIMYNIPSFFSKEIFERNPSRFDTLPNSDERKIIYGLNITCADWGFSEVNGLDLNIGASEVINVNGVSISGLYNVNSCINGLAVSILCNRNGICNGIEVSLINNTIKLHGFQIGLWNINQKRSLPLLNWCFKK